MMSESPRSPGRARMAATLTAALSAVVLTAGTFQFGSLANRMGVIPSSWKWTLALAMGAAFSLASLAAFWLAVRNRLEGVIAIDRRFAAPLRALGPLNLALALMLAAILPILLTRPIGVYLTGAFIRLALLWLLSLAAGALLVAWRPSLSWAGGFPLALGLLAIVYRLSLYAPQVSTYPFSLGYSETSRYYYASLFFGKRIYSLSDLGWPVLHPSRYLLQSLAFLIPSAPLWFHRLWQVLLWILMTGFSAAFFVRRLALRGAVSRLIWGLWAALFLLQGPVYYHLLPCVMLILWGFHRSRFWRTMAIVLLASAWAGISRVNWIPVPAMLATALYLLEVPRAEATGLAAYLKPPVFWSLAGVGAALGAQSAYAALAHGDASWLASIGSSPLFWYRLFPSATNPLGVVPALAIAALPLILLTAARWSGRAVQLDGLRALLLVGILVVFLAGGLVVSTKIGGGDDLHNMDAFLVFLMLIGGYALREEPDLFSGEGRPWAYLSLKWAAFLVPVGFALSLGGPVQRPDLEAGWKALDRLRASVAEVSGNGGEVLFIAERHLLTFGMIEGVKLVPEYEKTFLMEMAMSSNEAYLERFSEDLRSGRFALIVTNPQGIRYKGRDYPFGEEDDAWVSQVAVRILEAYKTVETIPLSQGSLALMVSKGAAVEALP